MLQLSLQLSVRAASLHITTRVWRPVYNWHISRMMEGTQHYMSILEMLSFTWEINVCSANILPTWKISANTQSRSDTNISHRTSYVWKSFCGTDLPPFDSRLKVFAAICLSSHMGNTTDPGLTWVIFYSVLCSPSYNVVTAASSGLEGANHEDICNLFQDALIQDLCVRSVCSKGETI